MKKRRILLTVRPPAHIGPRELRRRISLLPLKNSVHGMRSWNQKYGRKSVSKVGMAGLRGRSREEEKGSATKTMQDLNSKMWKMELVAECRSLPAARKSRRMRSRGQRFWHDLMFGSKDYTLLLQVKKGIAPSFFPHRAVCNTDLFRILAFNHPLPPITMNLHFFALKKRDMTKSPTELAARSGRRE